uniref:Uncharacterized protein n=1 Tax=Rhizophora mucronata TaxID=61149 RepID=A0A2P2NNH3_RHIMU
MITPMHACMCKSAILLQRVLR